jgi:hypothetical protein
VTDDAMELLYAASYEHFGKVHQGKIHAIREGERAYCGQELRYTKGRIGEGSRSSITCGGCQRSLESTERHEREWADIKETSEQKQREWWAWYSAYLKTPEWGAKRSAVIERANGLCEGCRQAPAVIAHHLTYAHAGNELLFELVAVCDTCHQKAHPDKELGR